MSDCDMSRRIETSTQPVSLFPIPAEVRWLHGYFIPRSQEKSITWHGPLPTVAKDLAERLKLRITSSDEPSSECRFAIGGAIELPACRLGWATNDGFLLHVTETGVAAAANSPVGLLYALDTLCQLADEQERIACVEISDRPLTPRRGLMIDLGRVVEQPDYVISLIPFLVQCRINQIYLNLENKVSLTCAPELAHPCAWDHQEVANVVAAAQAAHMEIIPIISSIGHMESILKHPAYAPLAEPNTTDHLAIYRHDARELLSRMLEEICRLFPGQSVHLGGDESPYLGRSLATTEKTPETALVESYADGMNYLAEQLRRCGRRPMIWADMVLKYPELARRLSHDIVLVHWDYGHADESASDIPEQLARQGYDVAVASAILADEPFVPLTDRILKNVPYLPRRSGLWASLACLWEPRTQTLPVARIGMAIAGASACNPFADHHGQLLAQASRRVYGHDISPFYRDLADNIFYDKMCRTRLNYYHCFELACCNPKVLLDAEEDPAWDASVKRLERGIFELNEDAALARESPLDHLAFAAAGNLALFLARRRDLVPRLGRMIHDQALHHRLAVDMAAQLRGLASQAEIALELQKKAWVQMRRADDVNFDWWFTQPLHFQWNCLWDLADEIENIAIPERPWRPEYVDYLRLRFNKGSAQFWNLLRMRIEFSWNGTEWSQVFFRTVPLWMQDGISIDLMPRGPLPQHIRMTPSAWTWHSGGKDWSDMVQWKVQRLRGCGLEWKARDIPQYDITAGDSGTIELLLKQ